VAASTAGGVYTSMSGLRQSQPPSMWSLRHDLSCICNRQTPRALHVQQAAIYECKWLGDSKLCSATRCESIRWSLTLANYRDVLEHRFAAKQHFVRSIWGTHNGDLARGMLKQRPTLDISRSSRCQVWAQVDKVKSRCSQSTRDNIADHFDLHRFGSDAENWNKLIPLWQTMSIVLL